MIYVFNNQTVISCCLIFTVKKVEATTRKINDLKVYQYWITTNNNKFTI